MTTKLFEASTENARGAVLVTHGLNNKPEAMDPMISILVRQGFHCLRISLYRDTPSTKLEPPVIIKGWMDELIQAYRQLSELYPGCPIHNLSYSLGALITVRALQSTPAMRFDKMALLAPPVSVTRSANLVRYLTPLARFGVVLPSAAPTKIRARGGTPLAEYAATFELVKSVQVVKGSENLPLINTKVFLDPDDELVRHSGVLEWIERNHLGWVAESLRERRQKGYIYRHLMILEEAMGRPAWEALIGDIVVHFTQP